MPAKAIANKPKDGTLSSRVHRDHELVVSG
ncbi:hypothetical protein BC739_005166 [Kutzneria viridogrisea]|uniref:Uncharacterized protein n=1 Tax=Kutzneria viridogrisea TaxID=47990 RepID=A0ABR6BM26_9PSEU|nr:hypothetical protein [Kutzneria viridogrisea]